MPNDPINYEKLYSHSYQTLFAQHVRVGPYITPTLPFRPGSAIYLFENSAHVARHVPKPPASTRIGHFIGYLAPRSHMSHFDSDSDSDSNSDCDCDRKWILIKTVIERATEGELRSIVSFCPVVSLVVSIAVVVGLHLRSQLQSLSLSLSLSRSRSKCGTLAGEVHVQMAQKGARRQG